MATWPAGLPTSPLLEGFEKTPGDVAVHTPQDEGPHKSRRRFSTPVHTYMWPLLLTVAEYNTLESFFYNDCAGGSVSFTGLSDPYTGSALTLKMIEVPKPSNDNQYIRCTLKLLAMP